MPAPLRTSILMRTNHLLASLLAAASPLAAQYDFNLDKVTAGTLGQSLDLQVRNAPASYPCLVIPSFTAGPTPLSLLDPTDPRSLEVGIDLLGNLAVLLTSPTGTGAVSTPLPNDPSFQGAALHWQAVTFPGLTTTIDELSNPVRAQVGLPGNPLALTSPLLAARAGATACWNRVRNAGAGDLLLVSGATTEFFQFRTLDAQAGPNMITPRALHAAATLNDGRVLFTGGVAGTGVTTACEIYDPATNTFTAAADLAGLRAGHAAATLPDGRVMVVGGTTNFTDLTTAITAVLNTTEIYNPATNTWAAGPNIGGRRLVPSLTRLSNGRLLLAGGIEVTVLFGIPIALTSTNKAQLYNPTTNSWSNAPNMPNGRAYHQDNAITLADGRVLLSGGVLVPDLLNATNAASIAGADLYDPATNTWQATTMSRSRTGHAAVRLPDNRVLVSGGAEGLVSAALTLTAVATFDPATNTWTDQAPMTVARAGHTAALLPDGMVVLLGGNGTSSEAIHF
jgi:N-acetylneuraminic acid mutarotase